MRRYKWTSGKHRTLQKKPLKRCGRAMRAPTEKIGKLRKKTAARRRRIIPVPPRCFNNICRRSSAFDAGKATEAQRSAGASGWR